MIVTPLQGAVQRCSLHALLLITTQVLKRQGYLVKTVRIDNGCYEVYGLDPLGRRIQKHFDPATAKPASEPSRSAYAPP